MTSADLGIARVARPTLTSLPDAAGDIASLLRQVAGGTSGLDAGALRSALDLLGMVAPDLAASLKGQIESLLSPVERGQFAAANDQPTGPSQQSVTVSRGDTLSAIAVRNGISLGALLRANPQFDGNKLGQFDRTLSGLRRDPDQISVGERIALPSGAQAARIAALVNVPEARTPSVGLLSPGAASVRAAEQVEARVENRASSGSCYRFVKEALLRAGAVSDYMPGVAAKGAGPALEARGFTNILSMSNIRSPYDAPVGAVLVYGAAPGATDRNVRYGHIEIRTANGFASDYFSVRARTGIAADGLDGRGRVLIGVYIKPDA